MAEERVQRRLTAILAADVVGYSRLMGDDEEGALATLRAYRQVVDELVAGHEGRVFSSAGDSVIAEAMVHAPSVNCTKNRRVRLGARSPTFATNDERAGLIGHHGFNSRCEARSSAKRSWTCPAKPAPASAEAS